MSDSPDHTEVVASLSVGSQSSTDIEALKAELAALRRELAEARRALSDPRSTQLVEANEHLLIAALNADTLAESARSDLAEMTRTSQRDPLTDIPNRTLMLDRLEQALAVAKRNRTRVAVLFLDLDQFKQVNDKMGHAFGDEVLKHTAHCVESVLRGSDTVSRHGGDEFLVMLGNVSQESDAAHVAQKILGILSEPCVVEQQSFNLSASLGIALYPEDGDDAIGLIAHADAAMYYSKRRGAGGFAFYAAAA